MGILDKFKRKKSTAPAEQHEFADPADQAAWEEGGHEDGMSQEEANGIGPMEDETDLSDIVQNETVEPGIPQGLTVGKDKTMRKFVFLGIGLLAVGMTVAGLINFAGSETEQQEPQVNAEEETAGNSQPKDFNKDKEKIAQEQHASAASAPEMVGASAASAPAASAASAVPAASSAPAMAATEQAESTPVTANPGDSIRKRRLSGSVLVGLGGGSDEAGGADNEGETTDQPAAVGSSASPSGGSFSDNDTDEDKPARGGSFASRLNPTQTASVSAQQRGDLTYLLTKGTNIRCGLDTRIITTQPGFTRCIVSKDVYSANGKVLLIERGSKIIGEQTSALLQGQARVFVLWNELETPAGVKVSLGSPGSGQLGEAGHGAYVDYHFWQRFGGAMMISLVSDLGENLSGRKGTSGNNNQITYENSSEAAQEMAAEALKNSINIPPTGTINQGAVLNIMVARDVNFNKVYERVDTDPLVSDWPPH